MAEQDLGITQQDFDTIRGFATPDFAKLPTDQQRKAIEGVSVVQKLDPSIRGMFVDEVMRQVPSWVQKQASAVPEVAPVKWNLPEVSKAQPVLEAVGGVAAKVNQPSQFFMPGGKTVGGVIESSMEPWVESQRRYLKEHEKEGGLGVAVTKYFNLPVASFAQRIASTEADWETSLAGQSMKALHAISAARGPWRKGAEETAKEYAKRVGTKAVASAPGAALMADMSANAAKSVAGAVENPDSENIGKAVADAFFPLMALKSMGERTKGKRGGQQQRGTGTPAPTRATQGPVPSTPPVTPETLPEESFKFGQARGVHPDRMVSAFNEPIEQLRVRVEESRVPTSEAERLKAENAKIEQSIPQAEAEVAKRQNTLLDLQTGATPPDAKTVKAAEKAITDAQKHVDGLNARRTANAERLKKADEGLVFEHVYNERVRMAMEAQRAAATPPQPPTPQAQPPAPTEDIVSRTTPEVRPRDTTPEAATPPASETPGQPPTPPTATPQTTVVDALKFAKENPNTSPAELQRLYGLAEADALRVIDQIKAENAAAAGGAAPVEAKTTPTVERPQPPAPPAAQGPATATGAQATGPQPPKATITLEKEQPTPESSLLDQIIESGKVSPGARGASESMLPGETPSSAPPTPPPADATPAAKKGWLARAKDWLIRTRKDEEQQASTERALADRVEQLTDQLGADNPRVQEVAKNLAQVRMNRAQRRALAEPPAEGESEVSARVQDARDRIAQEITGQPYAALPVEDQLEVNNLIRQGYGMAAYQPEAEAQRRFEQATQQDREEPPSPVMPAAQPPAPPQAKAAPAEPSIQPPVPLPQPTPQDEEEKPVAAVAQPPAPPAAKPEPPQPPAPVKEEPASSPAAAPPAQASEPSGGVPTGVSAPTPPKPQKPASGATAGTAAGSDESRIAPPERLGNTVKAKGARGTIVDTQFAVVDANDLVTSHDLDLNERADYPQEIQPRDRERKGSKIQVQGIYAKLDPNELGANYSAADGAPIVVAMNGKPVVLSGNGRSIALGQLYRDGHENSKKYRQWLIEHANEFGLEPEQIEKIANPVLVRDLRSQNIDLPTFAKEANEDRKAKMGAVEQARADAELLTPEIMSQLAVGEEGEIDTPANANFIRLFMQGVASGGSLNELTDSKGFLSAAGLTRIRNAVFARAYGAGSAALEKMAESLDSNIRNITSGMLQAAPQFAKMREGIAQGTLYSVDLAEDVSQAADKFSELRSQKQKVQTYLAQIGMYGEELTQEAKTLLALFDEHGRSANRIATILRKYAAVVEAAGSPDQQGMFGPVEPPTKGEMLQAAVDLARKEFPDGKQAQQPPRGSLFVPPQEPARSGQKADGSSGEEGYGEPKARPAAAPKREEVKSDQPPAPPKKATSQPPAPPQKKTEPARNPHMPPRPPNLPPSPVPEPKKAAPQGKSIFDQDPDEFMKGLLDAFNKSKKKDLSEGGSRSQSGERPGAPGIKFEPPADMTEDERQEFMAFAMQYLRNQVDRALATGDYDPREPKVNRYLKLFPDLEAKYAPTRDEPPTPGARGGRSEHDRPGELGNDRGVAGKRLITIGNPPEQDISNIPRPKTLSLAPHQEQAIAASIRATETTGGFLNSGGTGSGKSPAAAAFARHWIDQGKAVYLVAPQNALKFPTGQSKWPTGSYATWLKEYGLDPIRVTPGSHKKFEPGKLYISTYYNDAMADAPVDENTVLVLDECHKIKNVAISTRSEHGLDLIEKAHAVLYMSATPADKPFHIGYLKRMGILEGQDEATAVSRLGLRREEYESKKHPGKKIYRWELAPHRTAKDVRRAFTELFGRMIEAGNMIKHELPVTEYMDVDALNIKLPDEAYNTLEQLQKDMEAHFNNGAKNLSPRVVFQHMRRAQEPFKIPKTVELTLKELNEGRKVIIFATRVNDSRIVARYKRKLPGGDYETVEIPIYESKGTIPSLRSALIAEGVPEEDIVELHGSSEDDANEAMMKFQSADGETSAKVVIATAASGGEGINLDDTTGEYPRTILVMTPEFDAMANVQLAGRVVRMTTESLGRSFYIFADTITDQKNISIFSRKMKLLHSVVQGSVKTLDVGEFYGLGDGDEADEYLATGKRPGRQRGPDTAPAPQRRQVVTVRHYTEGHERYLIFGRSVPRVADLLNVAPREARTGKPYIHIAAKDWPRYAQRLEELEFDVELLKEGERSARGTRMQAGANDRPQPPAPPVRLDQDAAGTWMRLFEGGAPGYTYRPFQRNDTLMRESYVEYREWKDRPALILNGPATALLAPVWGDVSRRMTNRLGGFAVAEARVRQMHHAILVALENDAYPKDVRASAENLLDAIEQALMHPKAAEGIAAAHVSPLWSDIVVEDTLNHETGHLEQWALGPIDYKAFIEHPLAVRSKKALEAVGYAFPKKLDDAAKAAVVGEIGIRVMVKDAWDDLGLSNEEARELSEHYVGLLVRQHGAGAAIKILERIVDAFKDASTRDAEAGGGEPDRSAQGKAGGTGSVQTDARPPVREKDRRSWQSLRSEEVARPQPPAPPAAEATSSSRRGMKEAQPWQQTRPAWIESRFGAPYDKLRGKARDEAFFAAEGEHRAAVQQAVMSGKKVPPEVLEDYPELDPHNIETPAVLQAKGGRGKVQIAPLGGKDELALSLSEIATYDNFRDWMGQIKRITDEADVRDAWVRRGAPLREWEKGIDEYTRSMTTAYEDTRKQPPTPPGARYQRGRAVSAPPVLFEEMEHDPLHLEPVIKDAVVERWVLDHPNQRAQFEIRRFTPATFDSYRNNHFMRYESFEDYKKQHPTHTHYTASRSSIGTVWRLTGIGSLNSQRTRKWILDRGWMKKWEDGPFPNGTAQEIQAAVDRGDGAFQRAENGNGNHVNGNGNGNEKKRFSSSQPTPAIRRALWKDGMSQDDWIAQADFRYVPKQGTMAGRVYINEATESVIRGILAAGNADLIEGIMLDAEDAVRIVKTLRRSPTLAKLKPLARRVLSRLADAIEYSSRENGGPAVVVTSASMGSLQEVKSTVRHEQQHVHQQEFDGLIAYERSTALKTEEYRTAKQNLTRRFGYPADDHVLVSEVLAAGMAGQIDRLGLTEEATDKVLWNLIKEVVERHGERGYNLLSNAKPSVRRKLEAKRAATDDSLRTTASGDAARKNDRRASPGRQGGIPEGPARSGGGESSHFQRGLAAGALSRPQPPAPPRA